MDGAVVSVMSRSTRPRLITDFAFGALFYLGSIFGEGVEFRAMATPGASDGAFTESRSKEKNSRLQATNGRGRHLQIRGVTSRPTECKRLETRDDFRSLFHLGPVSGIC